MTDQKDPLFLIDTYALIYRSYFAFLSRPLRNPGGVNVSALFGVARTITALLNDGFPAVDPEGILQGGMIQPKRLAAVFDSPEPTFRHRMYSEYKATRQKAPEDLHAQVPLVSDFLKILALPQLSAPGYEADDIIATLAWKCRAEGRQCFIISSDKDLLQLVGQGVFLARPSKGALSPSGTGDRNGGPYEIVGPREVQAEWNVGPQGMLDILALIGDSSDNVPGVKGIGEKTAEKLMARYGSLDEIYRNLAGIEGALGKKLAEGREMAYFSRSLIELVYQVPLPIETVDDLSVDRLDRSAAAQYLVGQGIRQPALALGGPDFGASQGVNGPGGTITPGEKAPGIQGSGAPALLGAAGPQGDLFIDADQSLSKPGSYRPILDLGELAALLDRGRTQKLLALDFETDSLEAWNAKPVGVSLSLEPGVAVYVPLVAHGGTDPFVDPLKVRSLLGPLLSDPTMTIVAHNAKYDYEVSRAWGLDRWNCQIWDTMVAAWMADPERSSFSLDSLITGFLGLPVTPFDSVVPRLSTFDTIPLHTATRYSAEDADYTLRLRLILEEKLRKARLLDLFRDLEMPLLPILAEMEGAGIRIEGSVLREYGGELAEKLKKIEGEIYQLVGHPFNIASTKQLQEVLFVERKLKAVKKNKTGYSTDVGVLEELAREDPVPAQILRYRTLAKLKSTYVDSLASLAGEDGRLRTHYGQTGTATGRLSSRDPNLQNIPIRDEEGRKIRQAFMAEGGNLLISADYSQIELVVLAHLSGDPGLIGAFESGVDVHRRTAALIFNVSEDDVRADQRRIAKTINFGVMYGMSAFRLSNELGISRTEAQAFIDAYFRTYAGISQFIEETVRRTEQTGYAETILGRRRYIPTINSRNKTEKSAAERVAVNTPIQGSAADIVKLAMIRLDRSLQETHSPARLLLQVHDELILEAPESQAPEIAALVQKEMEGAITLRVPLRVSVETGKRWGDFH
jgi:DNA polymerase-1